MKKFIKSLILFFMPVMLFMLFAEILCRHIPNSYSYKANYLNTHGKEIETLILGNSHTFYGIEPDMFSSGAFNAAHVSQTFDLDYAILQKYSDKLSNLKTVIIPVSYFSLFEKLELDVEKWRLKDYFIYYDLNVPLSFIDRFEIFSKGNIENFKNRVLKNTPGITESGRWICGQKADLQESGKIAAKRHTIERDTAQMMFPEMQGYLKDIMEFCQKKNYKVILLTMPAWHTYMENVDAWQWQKTLETVQALEKKYENAHYFNFMADSQFFADDFCDGDHLNSQGAEKISRMLGN